MPREYTEFEEIFFLKCKLACVKRNTLDIYSEGMSFGRGVRGHATQRKF